MKAFAITRYGSADRLTLTDFDKPVPGPGQTLVRVRATSVNPYDWHGMRGEPFLARLMPGLGLRRPAVAVLGCDLAGVVEAVGPGVTRFRPGDEVFALVKGGGFGELAVVDEARLAHRPARLSHEEAAAVPMAGVTALLAVRDVGGVRPGRRVLVTGASGGVGTFAVQLAVAFGARVTGVCSAGKADLVRSLGAEEVVDYTSTDVSRLRQRFDVVVQIAGSPPRRVLERDGTLVLVGGPAGRWVQPMGSLLAALATGPLVRHKVAMADAVAPTEPGALLATLGELIDAGSVRPVVDRCYDFADLAEAVRYQEAGHCSGKVVVTVS